MRGWLPSTGDEEADLGRGCKLIASCVQGHTSQQLQFSMFTMSRASKGCTCSPARRTDASLHVVMSSLREASSWQSIAVCIEQMQLCC
jgi:hypothetical protein